jgi:hypothetical protein
LQGELGCLAQVRGSVAGAAGPQVQLRHDPQQVAKDIQVTCIPGPGQRGGAGLLGGGQVPRHGQHPSQQVAAHPGCPAGDVRDLPGLPGQLGGLV